MSDNSVSGETETLEFEQGGDEPHLRFSPGQILGGQFVIDRFLGEGGMGEVYAAFDRHVRETVALKTIRSKYSNQGPLLARLRREVQLARKLRHRNVCAVHGIHPISLESGIETSALSMELLDGEPLSALIPKGLWPLSHVLETLFQIASGLQAIHDLNILHRDLKPGNVMILTAKDGTRRAVITDFGLAHQITENDATRSILGTKAIVGTTPYMAPEQLRGEGASKSSDVYSLGVIAFEMVTGRLPFEGKTALAVALRRLKQEAPAPRDFRPGLPRRWDTVIRACLSSDTQDRPPSPDSFIKLLQGDESALAYWARRQKRRAFVASIGLSALGAAYSVWRASLPRIHPAEAISAYKRGLLFAQRRDSAGLQNAIQEFRTAARLDPNYAEAWASMANAYCSSAHYVFMDPRIARAKAEEAANKALALDENLPAAQAALAYAKSVDLRRWRSAEDLFRKAVSARYPDAMAHTWYAAFLGRSGRFAEAIAQAKAGVELEPGEYAVQNQLAYEYYRARQFRNYHDKALELVHLHPSEGGSHLTLARSLQWTGHLTEALQECDTAITFGDSPESRTVRGVVLAALNREEEAAEVAEWVMSYWHQKPLEANIVVALMASLREYDTAMDVLDRSYEMSDGTVLACPTNPALDGLRTLPRYRAFLTKLGFDPNEIERNTPRPQL